MTLACQRLTASILAGAILRHMRPSFNAMSRCESRSRSLRRAVALSTPNGGLMYLCRELQTLDARTYRMCDVVPARTIMCERLQALGYVEGRTLHNSIFGPGLGFRGHQFRYSRIESLSSKVAPAFAIRRTRNGAELEEGFSLNNVIASYVHVHWASNPNLAEAMAGACVRARATTNK